MKITDLRIVRRTIHFEPKYQGEERNVGPLDMYKAYDEDGARRWTRSATEVKPGQRSEMFVVIGTDEGITGEHGPVESRAELLTIVDGLSQHLIGADPLENRLLWDILSRFDRHSRSGLMMMAISAVDIALWDLKGKILGLPVYKLLGGGRNRIKPYISMCEFSTEPKAAKARALWVKNMGIGAQKWFFRYGPGDGYEGMRKNLDLAFALREALGTDYDIMFDCWLGWTVEYAKTIFRELAQIHPRWVEDILRPHMTDGYRNLKQDTSIPLAAGEHIYTRMEANAYLRENIFSVMQSDPAWCGGITEALRIGDLCEMYGTTFIPHAHTLMPALHVIAALPPDIAPNCEYLLNFMDKKNAFFTHNHTPISQDGWIYLNDTPGIGDEIDEERMISTETVTRFEF